jgi:hypothetical protein
METSYEVQYPKDMMRKSANPRPNWAESAIHTMVDSVEHYARAKPLPFALWALGIGFLLGWKLKPW